jgi:hypothetical protein
MAIEVPCPACCNAAIVTLVCHTLNIKAISSLFVTDEGQRFAAILDPHAKASAIAAIRRFASASRAVARSATA